MWPEKVASDWCSMVLPSMFKMFIIYVPELRNNLLSLGQLLQRGLTILFKDGACNLYHPSKGLIARTNMSANRMFIISHEDPNHAATGMEECLHTSPDLTHLWHQRYGHLSYKGLKVLQKKQMVHGLPRLEASNIACDDCFIGKQHQSVIPKKSEWRASKILELIRTDICGPIEPISNGGKRYLLCFIDDYSRKG